ncbi:MAG: carboxypeptidase regulatory-like domain-containing protein [Planctomycetes bacterium]|nr:carboxypeptidase regulatory-like domain-containing protein [Planctomycetota bacterium]
MNRHSHVTKRVDRHVLMFVFSIVALLLLICMVPEAVAQETGTISGRITGNSDGLPIANVNYEILKGSNPDIADEHAWVFAGGGWTDQNGEYTYAGLAAQKYRVRIPSQVLDSIGYAEENRYNVSVAAGIATQVDFALRKKGAISGRVVKASDGTPVANILVDAYRGEDPNIADEHSWFHVGTTQTDADGKYRLGSLDTRRYRVYVRPQSQDGTSYFEANLFNVQVFEDAETENMNLRVRQAGTIYGYVKTPDGDPIANAQVITDAAWTDHDNSWHWTRTDSQGRYEFRLAPSPGEFYPIFTEWVQLGGVDYAPQSDGKLYQATTAGTQGPNYTLQPGGTVTGRVENESGVGISGARLDLRWSESGSDDGVWTDTDASGNFALRGVPAGRNHISLENSWREIQHAGVKYMVGDVHREVHVTAGQTLNAGTFIIYEAGMVTGVIKDQAGNPIVGVEVELDGMDIDGNWAERRDVVSGALGQFTVDYVAPGTYQLWCDKEGFVSGIVNDITVARGQQVDQDVIMSTSAQGATLSGKIVNYLDIAPKDSQNTRLPLYESSYYEDYGYPNFGIIAIPMGQTFTEQDYLNIDSLFVGQVSDNDGIDDGYGDYFGSDGSETPGNYDMGVPPGQMGLFAYYAYPQTFGGMSSVTLNDWKSLALSGGDVRQDIDFSIDISHTGTVRGDLAVPNGYTEFSEEWCLIYAYLLDASGNLSHSYPLGNSVAWGGLAAKYEFQGLQAGKYQLRAYARNLASVLVASVTVSAGQATTHDITFSAGGTLTGQVTDGSVPVNGAMVEIVETGAQAFTSANGTYSISGLNTGTYTALATASGHSDSQVSVDITSGASTPQDFTLSSLVGSISGTVKTATGTNVNGATVVAYNETDDTHKSGQTVAGVFEIEALHPGSYLLAVDAGNYGVVVHPDGSNRISLAASQDVNNVSIVVGSLEPPLFTVNSSASDTSPVILSVEIQSDQDLSADPQVTIVGGAGSGTLGSLVTNPARNRFEIQYTAHADDTLVRLRVQETTPLVSGNPGAQTFSFEVSSNLVSSSSTNVTNALGGTAQMMGAQDNTQVYVPPFAIAGADANEAIPLVIERYGDPGDSVVGTDADSVTAVYDFTFDDSGVSIDQNHTFAVTMSFQLPGGMSQQAFTDSLEIRYFDAGDQQWKTDGISNIRINWTNMTILFDVAHLTKFAGFVGGTSSHHAADAGQDYVIGDFELLDYIDQWAAGQVGDFDLLDCIDLWAAGHYYWDGASSTFKPGYE